MTISSNAQPVDWENLSASFSNIDFEKPEDIGYAGSLGIATAGAILGYSLASPAAEPVASFLEDVNKYGLDPANDSIRWVIDQANDGLSWLGDVSKLPNFFSSFTIQTLPDWLFDRKFEEIKKATNWIWPKSSSKKKSQASTRKVLNDALEALISQGPDAMSNMFDVFFLIGADYKTAKAIALPDDYKEGYDLREFTYPILLSSRILSIDIPSRSISTYKDKLPIGSLDKPVAAVSFENKSSFSYRIDNDMIAYRAFANLSLTSLAVLENGDIVKGQDIPFSFIRKTARRQSNDEGKLSIIVKRAMTAPRHHELGSEKSTLTGEDAVYEPLGPAFKSGAWDNAEMETAGDNSWYLNDWFVFDDVRLLGSGDGFQFERESSGDITHTVEFIFKHLLRYNKQSSTFENL